MVQSHLVKVEQTGWLIFIHLCHRAALSQPYCAYNQKFGVPICSTLLDDFECEHYLKYFLYMPVFPHSQRRGCISGKGWFKRGHFILMGTSWASYCWVRFDLLHALFMFGPQGPKHWYLTLGSGIFNTIRVSDQSNLTKKQHVGILILYIYRHWIWRRAVEVATR